MCAIPRDPRLPDQLHCPKCGKLMSAILTCIECKEPKQESDLVDETMGKLVIEQDEPKPEAISMEYLLDKENKALRCYCEALEGYLEVILPEYEKYVKLDKTLDSKTKEIRLRTVDEANRTEKLNRRTFKK